MDLTVKQVTTLQGEIEVPGDKSISHRAIMLGALAEGDTQISNFLPGADCLSTIDCFRQLGIAITIEGTQVKVSGQGLWGLQEPKDVLDVGNSGTTLRLLMGILAGQEFFATLTGDGSIRRRPMGRVVEPLKFMGAQIWGRQQHNQAPLAVLGAPLHSINYALPVASAQVKSAILLAGLYAPGATVVIEPELSRDHTERMLQYFGAELQVMDKTISVQGNPRLTGKTVTVPGDISSAAYFLVAGTIVPNSQILIKNVGVNPTRDGILQVLRQMGADIQVLNQREESGEPVADLLVQSSALKGTTIAGDLIPRLIDEIPIIAVAATCAQGDTVIRDAAELKVKESNRIATTIQELSKLGAQITELPDGMIIHGGHKLQGSVCTSHDDHRIAMAVAIAGLVADGWTTVHRADCVDVSFPGFGNILQMLSE